MTSSTLAEKKSERLIPFVPMTNERSGWKCSAKLGSPLFIPRLPLLTSSVVICPRHFQTEKGKENHGHAYAPQGSMGLKLWDSLASKLDCTKYLDSILIHAISACKTARFVS
jgi:hypothetical protein